MENSEFVLSKLEAAVGSVKSIDLGAVLVSGILGLVTVMLALAAIFPLSILGLIRVVLLLATVATVFFSYWRIRQLIWSRSARLGILRKWQEEVFFAGTQLDSSEQDKIRKMGELIHSIEDMHFSKPKDPLFRQLDNEFMGLLETK
jgi:hypothetical protein